MSRLFADLLMASIPDPIAGLVADACFRGNRANKPARSGFDDPVYKENVRKLIERNRGFGEESHKK